jgi:uncharacterized membrane protein YdbT with pleckstrin-like domain
MSPSADSANPTAQAEVSSAEQILQGGEEIILAIKPSPWFVVLVSWPVLLTAAVVAAAAYGAVEGLGAALPRRAIYLLCAAGAMVRIVVASLQWMARLYMLTNLRVVRIRGVLQADIRIHLLQRIQRTHCTASPAERVVGVGTVSFEVPEEQPADSAWVHVSRPREVEEAVNQAIRRSRQGS